jgi:DNA replication protein DnaC
MLNHPTLEKLQSLRLTGMVKAFEDQAQTSEIGSLSFEERLGLMVDREMTERENRRLTTRLKKAKLRQAAVIEDIDYRHPRGLDKALMTSLASCRWIRDHDNVLLTGPTGVGKSYLACALAHKACREGFTALYLRLPRLCQELAVAKGDGRFAKMLTVYARMDLLVLDDWGLAPLTAEQRRDLLEILDDRYAARSTLVASQIPVERWHDYLDDPTVADAILDRLIHNAHRITLKGESLRKKKTLTKTEKSK